jgi:hypothetical protein
LDRLANPARANVLELAFLDHIRSDWKQKLIASAFSVPTWCTPKPECIGMTTFTQFQSDPPMQAFASSHCNVSDADEAWRTIHIQPK